MSIDDYKNNIIGRIRDLFADTSHSEEDQVSALEEIADECKSSIEALKSNIGMRDSQ